MLCSIWKICTDSSLGLPYVESVMIMSEQLILDMTPCLKLNLSKTLVLLGVICEGIPFERGRIQFFEEDAQYHHLFPYF